MSGHGHDRERDHVPPGCVDAEELSAFLDGELPAEVARRVRDHASSCSRCATLLGAMAGTSRALAGLPREAADEALVKAVARRAAEDGSAAPRERRSRRSWTGWATAAAVLLGSVLLYRVVQEVPLGVSQSPAPSPQEAAPAPPPAPSAEGFGADASSAREAESAAPVATGTLAKDDAMDDALLDRQERRSDDAPAARPRGPSEDSGFAEEPGRKDERALAAHEPPPSPAPVQAAQSAPAAAAAPPGALAAGPASPASPPPPAEQQAKMRAESAVSNEVLRRQAETDRDFEADRKAAKEAPADAVEAEAILQEEIVVASPKRDASARARIGAAAGTAAGASESEPPAVVACGRERRAAEDQPIAAAAATEAPILRKRVEPDWPATSPPGTAVTVEVVVELDGGVTPCRFLEPPDPAVESAVRRALKAWRYRPARLSGRPQAVTLTLVIARE